MYVSEESGPPMERKSTSPEPAKKSPDKTANQAARVQDTGKPPRDYREAVALESAADKETVDKSHFKRYRRTWILLVLFIVTVAVAFFLYPRRSAVYRPPPFQVKLLASEEIRGLLIYVRKLGANHFDLLINLETNVPELPQSKEYARIYLQLPVPVTRGSCMPPDCRSRLSKSVTSYAERYDVAQFTDTFGRGATTSTSATNFRLVTPVFAWDENGVDIEAQLPSVQLLTAYPHQPIGNPNITVAYDLSGAVYDWTGGPSPSYVIPQDGPQVKATVWKLTSQELLNPMPVNGTDSSTAALDSFRIFLSGALLGIAGGALVGAIQEAIH